MNNPHSMAGQSTPPMYGDYEAQRHWMEITLNLPISEWYHNTTQNDLLYWGLDYPPLTAYLSFLFGLAYSSFYFSAHVGADFNTLSASGWHVEDGFMELTSSRGWESEDSKLFMRGTVLLSDLLIF